MAIGKCNMMLKAAFLAPVAPESQNTFKDGTRLYRFAYREELQAKADSLAAAEPAEGSEGAMLLQALQATLELPDATADDQEQNDGEDNKDAASEKDGKTTKTFGGISTRHLQARRFSVLSTEQQVGYDLARKTADIERLVDIQDRKHNFKTYPKCFVGSDAVTVLVDKAMAADRSAAVQQLEDLLQANLIAHVTRDHLFEDKKFFYGIYARGRYQKGD